MAVNRPTLGGGSLRTRFVYYSHKTLGPPVL